MQTYCLDTELQAFIGDFLERQEKGLDNVWIVKPTAMARSIDTWVVNNVEQVCRLMETGPKIIQKYISRPLLLQGRKYTLRMHVIVQSLLPLRVYVHREHLTQKAANQYTMDEDTFTDFATHMTVMGYGGLPMEDLTTE